MRWSNCSELEMEVERADDDDDSEAFDSSRSGALACGVSVVGAGPCNGSTTARAAVRQAWQITPIRAERACRMA